MERFIPYGAWSRRSRGASPSSHPIGSTVGVTFHWTGPAAGTRADHDHCYELVRGIQAFHRDSRGWADIAYNLIPCPHGYVFEGRGVGTTSAANGDTQSNADWYAVCYLGGVGEDFTDDGKAAMRWARDHLVSNGAGTRVNGHRDHKSTTCPGDVIYRWLNREDWSASPDPEEDDMALSNEDVEKIAAAVWRHFIEDQGGTRLRAEVMLKQVHHRAGEVRDDHKGS